jgi:predicted amidohydrolase
MTSMRIALLQMVAQGSNQAANLAKGVDYCRRARDLGADIALFPEMWNIGYERYEPRARQAWQAQAVGADSPFVRRFRELALELGMAIAVTYLERWPGAPRNTMSLIDRQGQLVLTYAKVHTCDFKPMELGCTPGEDFAVCTLDTLGGPLRIGAMICFDREAPESARILMLKGAELILTPNACTLDDRRIHQFATRAFENAVGVAMANYAAPQQNGRSVAFAADGMPIIEAPGQEGVYLAEFDLDALYTHRAETIWGNAYRRPHRYELLTSMDVSAPFERYDGDGAPFDRSRR